MASALPTELSSPPQKLAYICLKFFILFYDYACFAYMHVFYHVRARARGGQKMVLEPLKLEIREVVNCPEDAGDQILVFCKPPSMPPSPAVTVNSHHLWLLFCRVSFS